MGLFDKRRPAETPQAPTTSIHEEVATLRGRIAALELEWDDVRGQIRKGYQRLERAAQRAEAKSPCDDPEPEPVQFDDGQPGGSFMRKWSQLK